MKSFYIKELNKGFICLNKSGSLLLLNTFYDFSHYKGYTITDGLNDTNEDTELFIFVRNPIERLKTSFSWFLGYENFCKEFYETYDNYNPIDMFTMDNFKKFINRQSEIYKLKDYHFLPQKYDICNVPYSKEFTITDELIKTTYPNYQIIKLEEFSEELFKSMYANYKKLRLGVNHTEEMDSVVDYVFLNSLNLSELKLFTSLYLYNKTILDTHHHSNKVIDIDNNLEKKIFFMLEDEYNLYGYETKEYFKRLI